VRLETTHATPEQFVAALTDFGPGRSELFANSAERYLKVHDRGAARPTSRRARTASGRLHYDWSNPEHGRSGHTYVHARARRDHRHRRARTGCVAGASGRGPEAFVVAQPGRVLVDAVAGERLEAYVELGLLLGRPVVEQFVEAVSRARRRRWRADSPLRVRLTTRVLDSIVTSSWLAS
jgi:hypothetical protein